LAIRQGIMAVSCGCERGWEWCRPRAGPWQGHPSSVIDHLPWSDSKVVIICY